MTFKYEKSEKYDNISFKLKDLELNKPIKIRISFDEPKTGEGKYGTWYLFGCEVLEPEAHPKANFFASKALAEELQKYSRGDEVTITKEYREGVKGPYTHYEVKLVSGATPSEPRTKLTGIVDILVKSSNGQQQSPSWIKEQLKAVGVDEALLPEVVGEYSSRW